MEYSFRSSPMDESVTVVLSSFTAVIRRGSKEEYIPYANITSVRLSRFGKQHYRLYLYQDSLDPILISNRNYDGYGKPLEQSKSYHEFVRALHRHLNEKSHAVYTSGSSPVRMALWCLGFLAVSFGLSFSAHYFGVSLFNFYVEGVVLFILLAAVSLSLRFGIIPKPYSPTDIPIQFLP